MNVDIVYTFDRNDIRRECVVFSVNGDDNLNNYSLSDEAHKKGENFNFPDWKVKKGTSVYLYTKKGENKTVSYKGEFKHILFRGSDNAFWQEENKPRLIKN